ncbi:MrcB family domain-containing protein [Ammoniphilus sp. YIM 78166]|uniref:MrcB family domain-containing protein n=1 Tax=Ammoniphilus sp. YIM 78166 TaxID=1644106 RepID=UPI001F0D6CBB|nr:DUF3578 domain-containing protein [Ammoniphilus sp. YIM 78166]
MALPLSLAGIFKNRQKSYKMVLILSVLEEMWTSETQIPLHRIADRFVSFYLDRENQGLPIDEAPKNMASSWREMTTTRVINLLQTPIQALSSVLITDSQKSWIGFRPDVLEELSTSVRKELKQYALDEIEAYFGQSKSFSLRDHLTYILSHYLQAKTETFKEHPLGIRVRQQIPQDLQSLSFIDQNYKVQGSVGQGNWATIPWIAIMDKRITESTQYGEYIVYLFSEDMSSVYLTLAQGVTVPLKDKGKKEGYDYLEQKVREMRDLLSLESFQKDDNIHLTSSGIGRDYQVSTVAYIRYFLEHMPEEDRLISDLRELMENYRLYAEGSQKQVGAQPVSFKYTMAYLHYIQGILHYLGSQSPRMVDMDELVSQQALILKKGDEVKHPKQRIQHIGRAIEELGLIQIEKSSYLLTELGQQYCHSYQDSSDIWNLTPNQKGILQNQIQTTSQDSSNLRRVILLATNIAKELQQFTQNEFQARFIPAMELDAEWGDVTQANRAKFMLNWLQEIGYIEKVDNLYIYLYKEDVEAMEHVVKVDEQLSLIKSFILQKGFYYPDNMIENFYLSLKTKPFVILAGISGTGKTKLVKLFAEALGAKMELIPVRPDWSDPTDLLGYRDLSGHFREGRLTRVLLDALQPHNKNQIYFICLDEMNLARVEHYFSDILSVMETERWEGRRILTDSLLSGEENLGSVYIPDNVYLIGTVNMDETTHPFSKKVLDRAQAIEFNYINLNSFPGDVIEMNEQRPMRVANSFLKREYLTLQDAYSNYPELIKRTTERLVKMNNILEKIHAHVGFRVRDSICFYMVYNEQFGLMSEKEAFDLQWLQKILPRIQGSSSSVKRVLIEFMQLATGQRTNIEEMLSDSSELFNVKPDAPFPLSARKIAYMLRRFEEDGFTSFWLS